MQAVIKGNTFEVEDQPADFWGWVKEGHYDKDWNVISAHLKPEHTFLDLGAWIGSHSLFASKIAKDVIAVEPDPVAFKILLGNCSMVPNILPVPMAVSGHKGKIKLGSGLLGASTTRKNQMAGGGMGAWEDGQEFWADCTTLRSIFDGSLFDGNGPLFIKMDVEGSEEDILQDVDFFAEHKPILYLEQHPWWWKDKQATADLIEKVSKVCTLIS